VFVQERHFFRFVSFASEREREKERVKEREKVKKKEKK
jgi:hypothetical protein